LGEREGGGWVFFHSIILFFSFQKSEVVT
jgi:hypothetical protein